MSGGARGVRGESAAENAGRTRARAEHGAVLSPGRRADTGGGVLPRAVRVALAGGRGRRPRRLSGLRVGAGQRRTRAVVAVVVASRGRGAGAPSRCVHGGAVPFRGPAGAL